MKRVSYVKNFIKPLIVIFILHLVVLNTSGDILLNFEHLARGGAYNQHTGEFEFVLYNYLLNIGIMISFICVIFKPVSQIFNMHNYILIRSSYRKFKLILIKAALYHMLAIIVMKQLIYTLFFIYAQGFVIFYLYDLISTFLTLGIYALIFILLKLKGFSEKLLLFTIISFYMIILIFSHNGVAFLSVLVIASNNWYALYLPLLISKAILLVLLTCAIFLQDKIDRIGAT